MFKKDSDELKQVQKMSTKTVQDLKATSYEEQLKWVCLGEEL